MSASQATTGYLAAFFTGSVASPISYTQVAELKSIKPNILTVGEVDVTHLQSPNATEEVIPGLIKTGTVEIGGNFTGDASQTALSALANARTVFAWKITAPVASGAKTYTATGMGFLTKWDTGPVENNKATEFAATLKITGAVLEAVA
jgi:hypothetical protein